MSGATLEVLSTVSETEFCFGPDDVDPPPQVSVHFELGEGEAAPGEEVDISFNIESNRASQGFSISVDFDEELLEALSVTRLWERPDGTPFDFEIFEVNNNNDTPGNSGVDEGFVVGGAIISLTDTVDVLPPFERTPVLNLTFRVREGAEAGTSELRFLDGAVPTEGAAVENKLIANGEDVTPSLASSFVFVDGQLNITPDVTTFSRGDANGDFILDISDGIHMLGYIFDTTPAPFCLDVLDANDDGRINLTDPLFLMRHIFLGTTPPPPPSLDEPGRDPTPDDLPCGE